MAKVIDYLNLVKFSHTVFAMPFALLSFVYAAKSMPEVNNPYWWVMLLVQVVLCMVFARNVAMGFNRWADRFIDADNPRTANREIPAGKISPKQAAWFVAGNALLFIVVSATINPLCGWLSPVALAIVMFYSYCKRFTSLAHIVLGLSLGIAPVGATIAVLGEITPQSIVLAMGVMCWSAGFDIIYALQDAEFDRSRGLHSVPSRFTARTSLIISALLHVASISFIVLYTTYQPQSWLAWLGFGFFTVVVVSEHILVTPTKQRNIGIAFGTFNALASVAYGLVLIANLLIFG
ncbi:MAG: putative 4-hydroxybenzoate polyprenyltransferase [Alistipes sp.]|nr:putative 4-hydroxybenzoate polyprenyltransferase [Alistipes sp.]